MNKDFAKQYPKWRRKCLECKCLGRNSPEGIYCKYDVEIWQELIFIAADRKPFKCDKFEQWRNKNNTNIQEL